MYGRPFAAHTPNDNFPIPSTDTEYHHSPSSIESPDIEKPQKAASQSVRHVTGISSTATPSLPNCNERNDLGSDRTVLPVNATQSKMPSRLTSSALESTAAAAVQQLDVLPEIHPSILDTPSPRHAQQSERLLTPNVRNQDAMDCAAQIAQPDHPDTPVSGRSPTNSHKASTTQNAEINQTQAKSPVASLKPSTETTPSLPTNDANRAKTSTIPQARKGWKRKADDNLGVPSDLNKVCFRSYQHSITAKRR
jgi:hypothetical protein